MEQRERYFYLIAGMPKAGKSTFTAKLIKGYTGNVIILKHLANIDDKAFDFLNVKTQENWRQGAAPGTAIKCKMAGQQKKPYKEFLRWIMDGGFRNGLLIIDDATIFERDRLTEEMNELVTMRRHYGIDIILIYHGLTLLPIEQFVFCNKLILFNTTDNFDYKKNKIPEMEQLNAAVLQVKKNYSSTDKKYVPVIVNLT